jgi:A/G-specific adenine glycosylase
MLQQTRVETVIPYYRRWLERFPTVDSLADASAEEVLEQWSGLGYYSRARNLHRAAAVLRDRGGRLPSRVDELMRLPGVGRYTAGAVASIAFGEAAPAVDGNARRVLCRLLDLTAPAEAHLQEVAARLVDPRRPGDFNQALMDLGATVCTPRAPRCGSCPLGTLCAAAANGTAHARTGRARRRPPPERSFAVAVLIDARGRALMIRRPERGLLAGLWAFPEVELQGPRSAPSAARGVARALGYTVVARARALAQVRHAFTHLRARYFPVLLEARGGAASPPPGQRWVDPSRLGSLAVPTAQRRIAASAWSALERPEPRSLAGRASNHSVPRGAPVR